MKNYLRHFCHICKHSVVGYHWSFSLNATCKRMQDCWMLHVASVCRGGRYRTVNLPSPYIFSQFLPPPYFLGPFLPPPYYVPPPSLYTLLHVVEKNNFARASRMKLPNFTRPLNGVGEHNRKIFCFFS